MRVADEKLIINKLGPYIVRFSACKQKLLLSLNSIPSCAFPFISNYVSLTSATLADLYPHSILVLDLQFHWTVIPLTTQGRHCVGRRGTIPAPGTQQHL